MVTGRFTWSLGMLGVDGSHPCPQGRAASGPALPPLVTFACMDCRLTGVRDYYTSHWIRRDAHLFWLLAIAVRAKLPCVIFIPMEPLLFRGSGTNSTPSPVTFGLTVESSSNLVRLCARDSGRSGC